MLPRRSITLVQQFALLKIVQPRQIRSFTSLMPPKRSTRAKPNAALPPTHTEANGVNQPTSMLHALAHVPPAPPGPPLPHAAEEDDDLTPPPDLSPVKPKQEVDGGAGKAKKVNGKVKAKAEPVDEEMTPTPSELDDKQTELEQRVTDEIVGDLKGKRRKARVSYTETAPEEGLEEQEEEKPAKKGKQTPKKKVQDEYEPDGNISAVEDEPAPITPKKGGRKKAVKTPATDGEENGAEEDGEATPAKEKKPRKPTPKKSRLAAKDEPEFDDDGNEIVKKKRKPKVYPKIEYVIPDVPKKTTNFKGRLGYACLNTVLRTQKPDSVFCSRTCRIASIEEEGMELPKGLALMNVKDLYTMIEVSSFCC
jgi:hypothetical protein